MARTLWIAFKNVLEVAICLAGLTLAARYLYIDFTLRDALDLGSPVGTIETKLARLKRRPATSYYWEPAGKGQPVYRQDILQSGPESSALVTLGNGTRIELGENTQVVIDETSLLGLSFLRGSVVLREPNRERALTSGPNGVREITLQQRLLAPAQSESFYVSSAPLKVAFKWKDLSGGKYPKDYLRLQVSTDKRFLPADVTFYMLSDFKGEDAEITLPYGRYYWRIQSPSGPTSEVRTFQIKRAVPAVLTFPPNKAKVAVRDGAPLALRWQNPPLVEHFADETVVELKKDGAEKPATYSLGGNVERAEIESIAEGAYSWIVRSRFGATWVPSEERRFVVERSNAVAVVMETPEENALGSVPKELRFTWSTEAEGPFLWELEKFDGKSYVGVEKKNVPVTTVAWQNPKAGVFRWRVSEQDWRAFTLIDGKIALSFPAEGQQVYFWKEQAPLVLQWKGSATGEYRFELADDYRFQSIRVTRSVIGTKTPVTDLPKAAATYFWRVRQLDKEGKVVRLSETRSVKYGQHPPYPPVMLSKPESGAIFHLTKNGRDPVLTWKRVADAKAYVISIQSDRTNRTYTEIVKVPSFTVKNFGAGEYSWSVRAIDRLDRKGEPSSWRTFTLYFGQAPPSRGIVSETSLAN